MKLGQMRNSDSFRSLEERVGSAYENMKVVVANDRRIPLILNSTARWIIIIIISHYYHYFHLSFVFYSLSIIFSFLLERSLFLMILFVGKNVLVSIFYKKD